MRTGWAAGCCWAGAGLGCCCRAGAHLGCQAGVVRCQAGAVGCQPGGCPFARRLPGCPFARRAPSWAATLARSDALMLERWAGTPAPTRPAGACSGGCGSLLAICLLSLALFSGRAASVLAFWRQSANTWVAVSSAAAAALRAEIATTPKAPLNASRPQGAAAVLLEMMTCPQLAPAADGLPPSQPAKCRHAATFPTSRVGRGGIFSPNMLAMRVWQSDCCCCNSLYTRCGPRDGRESGLCCGLHVLVLGTTHAILCQPWQNRKGHSRSC